MANNNLTPYDQEPTIEIMYNNLVTFIYLQLMADNIDHDAIEKRIKDKLYEAYHRGLKQKNKSAG